MSRVIFLDSGPLSLLTHRKSVSTAHAYVSVTTSTIRLAAQLWADIRQRGLPTTDPRELDVDVILAAQALNSGFPIADLIVATTNPAHISRFLAADLWTNI